MTEDANEKKRLGETTVRLASWHEGDRIGPYRIIHKLGEGGMGVVYLAEQTEPIRRRVALKIVKLGVDLDQIIARFQSERQALALMDHPGIAEIFEAGATAEGLPYFVMEHVSGDSITQYCDQRKLGIRDRLNLFVQVCEAIQHAHHKAIIHRDLKPNNILVAEADGKAVPKIIDFGLAKALAQPLTDKSLYTGIGQLLGTPKYMSPEQADLLRQNVDTRTDIYSLGGVLYELLVGAPPFELQDVSFSDMLRIIKEQDPVKPSRKLRLLPDAERVATNRTEDVPGLERTLRGDLDSIALKALDKDRNRRYSSPGDMAADIKRYLSDEPVQARPASLAYRTRKFVRRHRLGVAAMASIVALMLVSATLLALQARRIVAERDRANAEAATAEQVASFLTDLFKVSDPKIAQGRQPTVREVLDRGAGKIQTALSDQPLVRARLAGTIAEAYENLGLYSQAEQLYRLALETQSKSLGQDRPETLATMGDLYAMVWRQGRFQEAEEGLSKTLESKKRLLGPEHISTLNSVNNLANLYMLQGKYNEAQKLYEMSLSARERVQGKDHSDTLGAMNNLANLYSRQGKEKQALELYERTYEGRRRTQGENHPDTIGAAANLAESYSIIQRFKEAEKLHLEVLERRRKVLGAKHPDTAMTLNSLGDLYRITGRAQEAEKYLTDSLAIRKETLGENHPDTIHSLYNLGKLRTVEGRLAEATALLNAAAEGWKRVYNSPRHPYVLQAQDALARIYYQQGKFVEAERVFRDILDSQRQEAHNPAKIVDTLFNLACVNARQADKEEALVYLRQVVDSGFSDIDALGDGDLDSLRSDGEFKRLEQQVRNRGRQAAE